MATSIPDKTIEERNAAKLVYLLSKTEVDLTNLPYFHHRGKWFIERCGIQDAQGRKELAFSDAIKGYHQRINQGFDMIIEGCTNSEQIVFTTFQWLATNVGSSVLEEALKASNKVIVDRDAYKEYRKLQQAHDHMRQTLNQLAYDQTKSLPVIRKTIHACLDKLEE